MPNPPLTELVNNGAIVMMPAFEVSDTRIKDFSASFKTSSELHWFPAKLMNSDMPCIAFRLVGKTKPAIFLPIPVGLTFSDAALYSSIDLGIIGQVGSEAIMQMNKQDGIAAVIGAGAGGLAGSVMNKFNKSNTAAIASFIARQKLGLGAVADVIDFSTKQVVAPNTNTTFNNMGLRNFSFSFKLVAKSKAEAQTITKLIQMFRTYMYPIGDDAVVEYPPLWSIDFLVNAKNSASESDIIPKIYPSYLTTFNSTYNASASAFHSDGTPVETDISITFQESKALTRTDIAKLI